jgi:hypothetical protein
LNEKSCLTELVIATLAAVLGGIILAWIPATRNFLSGILLSISQIFASIWNFLVSPISIPIAIFLLLVIMSIPVVWKFIALLFPRKEKGISLQDYKEDEIFHVVWTWKNTPPINPREISGFCPDCRTRLVYRTDVLDTETVFICDTCKSDLAKFDGDLHFALSTVWRQIERKINTGEWKQVVERRKTGISHK